MGSSSSQNSTSHGGALRGAAPWPLTCSGACQETNELPSENATVQSGPFMILSPREEAHFYGSTTDLTLKPVAIYF
ncbi:hypothetical protein FOVSG1_002962 [Fusarium oxysporum f. sp. vasinfectum]